MEETCHPPRLGVVSEKQTVLWAFAANSQRQLVPKAGGGLRNKYRQKKDGRETILFI